MFFGIAAAVFVLDRISKIIIKSNLAVGEQIVVIKNILSVYHINNTGAAFSNFSGQRLLLIGITSVLLVAVALYALLPKLKTPKNEKIALAMVFGGGAGNLFCRVTQGFVTDFIDIHIIPIFNVADIFICIGCGLLILSIFKNGRKV